jgi:hypothetical protein
MCEVTESESLERRLDWLAAENAELKAHVSQVWERCRALEDITRQARGEYSEAKGEIHRLRAGTASLRAACEAAREFLEGKVDCGLARQEKGRVLVLIRAALDGDAETAGETKTLTISPEQYELGSAVASGFTARGGPFVRREPYRLVRRLPDGNYLVEDPAASGTADGEGDG